MKKLFAVILSLGLIIAPVPVVNTAHASGGGGFAKQILGLVNGVVGSTVLMKCKLGAMQPSLMAYMAGSLTYVFGEISGGMAQKKQMKEQGEKLNDVKANMTEGGEYQAATVDAQIDDVKGKLKVVQGRRKWIMATKVIYGIATALAIFEIWRALPIPAGLNIPDNAACIPNPASNKMMTKAIAAAYSGLMGFAGGGIMGAAMGAGGTLLGGGGLSFILKFEAATDAGEAASTGLLNSAYGRIAFFAAATVLVMMIDGELKKEEEELKKQLADLEKVKNQFKEMDSDGLAQGDSTEGTDPGAGELGNDPNNPNSQSYALRALPGGIESASGCFSQEGSGVNFSSAGCKNPLQLKRPNFDFKLTTPSLVSGANTATDLANALSRGDMARANVEAGSLAGMAGRIDAINKKLMKKLNDDLKAKGKKPIDVNGELNRQIAVLNGALNKSNPGSGNFTMADIGDAGQANTTEGNSTDANSAEIQTAGTNAAVGVGANDPLADLAGIDSGLEDSLVGADGEKVASLEESLNDFEASEDDISNKPDVSIFKQLSNRYFLNYTKLFNRKEVTPPIAEPVPAKK